MQLKTIATWLAAVVAAYGLYVHSMSERGFVEPDEPRYASVAREMAVSGDWVTPRLAGEPWFEKPALLYWMGAAAAHLGVDDDRATRWPVALLSIVFLLYFYRTLTQAFGGPAGAYAAMILATTVGWTAFSQAGTFDLPLAATLGMALLALLPWIDRPDDNHRRGHLIFGAFLGLSVLAKGLVGPVLAVLALLPLLWDTDFRARASALIRPPVLAVFALISVPWYALCFFANGSVFVEEFIWKHHVVRFVSGSLQHVQPFWFFVPVLIAGLLPWTPLLGLLHRLDLRDDRRLRFLAAWALTAFVFFSLSTNKLPGYILPLLPPVAALMGIALARVARPATALAASALFLVLIPVGAKLLPEALAHGGDPARLAPTGCLVDLGWVRACLGVRGGDRRRQGPAGRGFDGDGRRAIGRGYGYQLDIAEVGHVSGAGSPGRSSTAVAADRAPAG